MMITRQMLVEALGTNPRGPVVKVFAENRPCLQQMPTHDAYAFHRHRRSARQVRRVLRRHRQRLKHVVIFDEVM